MLGTTTTTTDMKYRYKMYGISWGGPLGSWDRFITYARDHFTRTWIGNGVVAFTASPKELAEAARQFQVDAYSFVLAADVQFMPEVADDTMRIP